MAPLHQKNADTELQRKRKADCAVIGDRPPRDGLRERLLRSRQIRQDNCAQTQASYNDERRSVKDILLEGIRTDRQRQRVGGQDDRIHRPKQVFGGNNTNNRDAWGLSTGLLSPGRDDNYHLNEQKSSFCDETYAPIDETPVESGWLTRRIDRAMPQLHESSHRLMDTTGASVFRPEFPCQIYHDLGKANQSNLYTTGDEGLITEITGWAKLTGCTKRPIKEISFIEVKPTLKGPKLDAGHHGRNIQLQNTPLELGETLMTLVDEDGPMVKSEFKLPSNDAKGQIWACFDFGRFILKRRCRPPPQLSPVPRTRLVIALPKDKVQTIKKEEKPGLDEFTLRPQCAAYFEFKGLSRIPGVREQPYLWVENTLGWYPEGDGYNSYVLEDRAYWWKDFHEAKEQDQDRWNRIFRKMPLGQIVIKLVYSTDTRAKWIAPAGAGMSIGKERIFSA